MQMVLKNNMKDFFTNITSIKRSAAGITMLLALLFIASAVKAASTQVTITGGTKALDTFDVRGAISKGSGTFVIDHPLDPSNKLLYHSFVESPDVKNIYDGTVTLDANGSATIQLPAYFDALNTSVRYQYFPIGQAMPGLYIGKQESDNRFTIAGGLPGGLVSWQITGIRHDPYILSHPITPEVDKGPGQPFDKGQCVYEPLCQ